MKRNFFFRIVSWLDILFGITNLMIIFMIAGTVQFFESEKTYEEDQLEDMINLIGKKDTLHKATRVAEMCGMILIYTKLTYFLSLVE